MLLSPCCQFFLLFVIYFYLRFEVAFSWEQRVLLSRVECHYARLSGLSVSAMLQMLAHQQCEETPPQNDTDSTGCTLL